jgi:hypothetical protein
MHRFLLYALTALALLLSSVTVVSVWLAIEALIPDPFLMLLFAAAAAMLDMAKYLTWPLVAHLVSQGRHPLAAALAACALTIGGVSGWATFDRAMSGALGGHAEAAATQQRIADIEAARQIDLAHLAALDAERAPAQLQAAALRQRGIVSKAQQLDDFQDERRERARHRLESSSLELATLRAKPSRADSLPFWPAMILCIAFALVLEVFPAAVLTALRGVPAGKQVKNTAKTPETTPETPQDGAEDPMLRELLQSIASAGPGSPVVLREFVRTAKIGNSRAARLFSAAEERGALRKTPSGSYVAA